MRYSAKGWPGQCCSAHSTEQLHAFIEAEKKIGIVEMTTEIHDELRRNRYQ
jgi:hypothetical protein